MAVLRHIVSGLFSFFTSFSLMFHFLIMYVQIYYIEHFMKKNKDLIFMCLIVLQWDHEFQNQFLSGFKVIYICLVSKFKDSYPFESDSYTQFPYTQTIAILPLGSSGVVQLGSTQKVCIYIYNNVFDTIKSIFLLRKEVMD